jgi:RNA 2',3'-cyclic 3'-phosphodiesterase
VRLFVALNFPEQLCRGLWEAATPLRDLGLPVRWVPPEGIHLTLKFLGDVPEGDEPRLHAALGRAAQDGRPLALTVEGFGVFPGLARPRVIWAGVEPDPQIELLQHRVEQEFAQLDFPPEGRAFQPHVTLGRAGRTARPRDFARLGAALDALRYRETARLEAVDLMQSVIQAGGGPPVYHIRHRERLS